MTQSVCQQDSIGLQFISRKREIIQSNIYRILPKLNQVIYSLDTVYDTICVPTRFHRFTMHKSEKGDNSVKYLQNVAKS